MVQVEPTEIPFDRPADFDSLAHVRRSLARVAATGAVFGAVCEPFAGTPAIRRVAWEGGDLAGGASLTVRVDGDDFHDTWHIVGHREPRDTDVFAGNAPVHVYALGEWPERGDEAPSAG